MAQKTDDQLDAQANVIKNATAPNSNSPTRVGNMLIDLNDSKQNNSKGYQGTWVWADHADADPDWEDGAWGESSGDRGVPGDSNYVQDGTLIFKTETGFKYR